MGYDYNQYAWEQIAYWMHEDTSEFVDNDLVDAIVELLQAVSDLVYQRDRLMQSIDENGLNMPSEVLPMPDEFKQVKVSDD